MTTRDYLNALNISAPAVRLPGLSQPSEQLPLSTADSSANGATAAANGRWPTPSALESRSHTVDQMSTDKEEGELSEADSSRAPSTTSNQVAARRPPTGPKIQNLRRNVPRVSRSNLKHQRFPPSPASTGPRSSVRQPPSATEFSTKRKYSHSQHGPASHLHKRISEPSMDLDPPNIQQGSPNISTTVAGASQPNSTPSAAHTFGEDRDKVLNLDAQRRHAKAFIESWYRSGHTFSQLVDEGFDHQILRDLYEDLGLPILDSRVQFPVTSSKLDPISATTISSHGQEGHDPFPPSVTTSNQPSRIETEDSKQDPKASETSTRNAPSEVSNRESYIARLMAAKSKKPTAEIGNQSSSQAQEISQPSSNVPPLPPLVEACQFVNQLCKNNGISSPKYDFSHKKRGCLSRLRINQLPFHLWQHLEKSDILRQRKWEDIEPRFTISKQSQLEIEIFTANQKPNKQPGVRELAAVCHSVLTASIEATKPEDSSAAIGAGASKANDETSTPYNASGDQVAHQNDDSHVDNDTDEDAARAAAKRKAQTELLRQRLENLKSKRFKTTLKPQSPSNTNVNIQTTDFETSPNAPTIQDGGKSLHSASPTGRIPGLFMAAPPSSNPQPVTDEENRQEAQEAVEDFSAPPISLEFSDTPPRLRKRPVAADFHDDVQPTIMKRPLGEFRSGEEDESMIIEASEDELFSSEDDETSGQVEPVTGSASPADRTPNSRKLANSGPLRSLSGDHRAYLADRTLTPVIRDNGFDRHQQDIVAMKKKIAELEKKRKSKLLTSGSTTPTTTPSLINLSTEIDGEIKLSGVGADAFSKQVTKLGASSEDQVSHGQSLNNNNVITHATDARPSDTEWKQRRRTELRRNIPALDARFAEDSRELDRLQQQMQQLRDEMQKREESKRLLIEELEALGVDTEGMEQNDLEAAKAFLTSQAQNQGQSSLAAAAVLEPSPNAIEAMEEAPTPKSTADSSASSMSISTGDESLIQDDEQNLYRGRDGQKSHHLNVEDHPARSALTSQTKISDEDLSKPSNSIEGMELKQQDGDHGLSEADRTQEQSNVATPATGSSAQYADDESMDSSEDSNDAESSHSDGARVPTFATDQKQSHQANVDMVVDSPELDHQEPSNTTELGAYRNYTDWTKPNNPSKDDRNLGTNAGLAISGSNSLLNNLEKGNESGLKDQSLEHSDVMEESEDEYNPLDDLSLNPTSEKDKVNHSRPGGEGISRAGIFESDDLAGEIQGNLEYNETDTDRIAQDETLPETERFTPYQSSLRNFKSSHLQLRPSDAAEESSAVSTMSPDKFDHELPLCPFELAGGVCNDNKCAYQHFQAMRLSDT